MDARELTLLNPTVIIEISSPSTEIHERKEKLVYYRSIESLQEYIFIAQDMQYIQQYICQTSHPWLVHLHDDSEAQIVLESVGAMLSVRAIYDGIVSS